VGFDCAQPTTFDCAQPTTFDCAQPTTFDCAQPTTFDCAQPTANLSAERSRSTASMHPVVNSNHSIGTTPPNPRLFDCGFRLRSTHDYSSALNPRLFKCAQPTIIQVRSTHAYSTVGFDSAQPTIIQVRSTHAYSSAERSRSTVGCNKNDRRVGSTDPYQRTSDYCGFRLRSTHDYSSALNPRLFESAQPTANLSAERSRSTVGCNKNDRRVGSIDPYQRTSVLKFISQSSWNSCRASIRGQTPIGYPENSG